MDALTYSFRYSLFRKEMTLRLEADAIELARGDDRWRVSLGDIATVRLFVAPAGMGAKASFCTLVPQSGPKLKLRSSSIVGMGKYEDRSGPFRAFVSTLVPRVAAANPRAQFLSGPSTLMWLIYLIIVIAAAIMLLLGIVMAVAGAMPPQAIASFVVIVVLLPMLWRVVRRGRPHPFDPQKLDASGFFNR